MSDYKKQLEEYKILVDKIERVRDILLVRLPTGYKEDFGQELKRDVIESAVKERFKSEQQKRIQEVFQHLSEEDLVLALDYVFAGKFPEKPKKPAPPKPEVKPVVKAKVKARSKTRRVVRKLDA